MVSEQAMSYMVETIIQLANPRRIVLFGSYARKTMQADSDIDLMVVVSDDVVEVRTLTADLHIALSRIVDVPCDLLVERESDFMARGAFPTLEQTILQEGHTLYAA